MTLTGTLVTGDPFSFQEFRWLLSTTQLQEGVFNAFSFAVSQRAAGANMSVDVSAGSAFVQIDTGTRNGLAQAVSDAVANLTITASNATNPRVDQIILRYNDTSIPTGSGNTPTLEVLTGTATAGATLDNRTGATALPNDCLRLADILVPATSTSVTTANIRDRRPWARGAYWFFASDNAGHFSTTSTTATALAATQVRLECSGAPLEIEITGRAWNSTAAANALVFAMVDGVTTGGQAQIDSLAANETDNFHHVVRIASPGVGSHLIAVGLAQSGGGTAFAGNAGSVLLKLAVREAVKPNANNGTT